MRKTLLITVLLLAVVLMPSVAFAQGMMSDWTSSPSGSVSDNHTVREETEGKTIFEKLKAKQLKCKNLTDNNFEVLGEYYMGQMTGFSHEAMNTMMEQMMGKVGEEQMHIVMGKRLSGCDTSFQIPQNGLGFMPMMWMMGGGANSMMGFGNMMGWSGLGIFGFLIWIFWIVVLVDLILLGIWLWKKIKKEK